MPSRRRKRGSANVIREATNQPKPSEQKDTEVKAEESEGAKIGGHVHIRGTIQGKIVSTHRIKTVIDEHTGAKSYFIKSGKYETNQLVSEAGGPIDYMLFPENEAGEPAASPVMKIIKLTVNAPIKELNERLASLEKRTTSLQTSLQRSFVSLEKETASLKQSFASLEKRNERRMDSMEKQLLDMKQMLLDFTTKIENDCSKMESLEKKLQECADYRTDVLLHQAPLRRRALLDYARDTAAHMLGFESWEHLLEIKGWSAAQSTLKLGLPENVTGWKGSREEFVDFISSGTTSTRQSGNRAADNFSKDKILEAVYVCRSEDRGALEQVIEFLNDVNGWWEEKGKQEEGAEADQAVGGETVGAAVAVKERC